jgi:Holliday junction resolvasome RuvABC DNA-binding subunit
MGVVSGKVWMRPLGEDNNILLEFTVPKDCFIAEERVSSTMVYCHCAVNANSGEETWYAFRSCDQLKLFRDLMTFDGIGPSKAFKVLNSTPWAKISELITTNNQEGFKALKGIPEKTADDIVKLVFAGIDTPVKILELNTDAVSALHALGWAKENAKKAVANAQAKGVLETEEIIKLCLRTPS